MAEARPSAPAVFAADRPIAIPQEDLLGYDKFASALAASISKMAPREGAVIAVYGKWGNGKSSVLNLVEHHLRQDFQVSSPILVRFNPWWFSGAEDLTLAFFSQIKFALGKESFFDKQFIKKLARFAEVMGEMPLPSSKLRAFFRASSKVSVMDKDITELKEDIVGHLLTSPKKILVVIDDIDRLDADEIRSIFKLVKAVGDFPNVVYLLAFDKDIVAKAIEKVMPDTSGHDYLQKIVQVPFELPSMEHGALSRILLNRLQGSAALTPSRLLDAERWTDIYARGIEKNFRNVRDVLRFTNSFEVTYPAVAGEVDWVDFVCIETIRVLYPELYATIRDEPNKFVGRLSSSRTILQDDEALKRFHRELLDKIPGDRKQAVRHMMASLFPGVDSLLRDTAWGQSPLAEWRARFRIASPDRFAVYFQLALPRETVSNAEVEDLMRVADDSGRLSEALLAYIRAGGGGPRRLVSLVDALEDRAPELDTRAGHAVVRALFRVGDDLVRAMPDRRDPLSRGFDFQLARITNICLEKTAPGDRRELLADAMGAGNAVGVQALFLMYQGRTWGKFGARESSRPEAQVISWQDVEVLVDLLFQRISAMPSVELLRTPGLRTALRVVQDQGKSEFVRQFVEKALSTEFTAIAFLDVLRGHVTFGIGTGPGNVINVLDPRVVSAYVDPERVRQVVMAALNRHGLERDLREALEYFLEALDVSKKGGDLDSLPDLIHDRLSARHLRG